MDFVDDVDLVATPSGSELDAPDDLLTNVVHAGSRRGIDLVDIGMATLGDLDAIVARTVGLASGAALTVKRLGEYSSSRGLPGAAGTGEQVRVSNRPVAHGVAQRALDVLLTDDVGERLRAILAVEGLVRHRWPFERA
jgi:hypothetical protein